MRRWIGLAALAAVLAAPIPAVARSSAGATNDPLEEARKAAEQTPFSGSVTLQWRDGSAVRQNRFTVTGAHGAVVAQGAGTSMSVGTERLVYVPGDGWHELWPSGLGSPHRPAIADSYDVRSAGTDTVAGYPTEVVEVVKAGAVRERLDLETHTKLLLRRRQYDARGVLERSFTFDQLRIGDPPTPPPTMPPAPKDDAPKLLTLAAVPATERTPAQLGAGFRRLGVYKQGGMVQMLYGDGLYDVSLFEQRGAVDADDLPAQRHRAQVDGRRAWRFSWPGGEGVVWAAGENVYTLVGDVPSEELLAVASSVPVHRSTSIAHRFRQACRTVVESFTGGR